MNNNDNDIYKIINRMMTIYCSVEGCNMPKYHKFLCKSHHSDKSNDFYKKLEKIISEQKSNISSILSKYELKYNNKKIIKNSGESYTDKINNIINICKISNIDENIQDVDIYKNIIFT